MNSKANVNRVVTRRNGTVHTLCVVGLMFGFMVVMSAGRSESIRAGFKVILPQAMNPEQVAASIKANAQALTAFNYQQRLQLQLKGETKKVTLSQISHDMNGNEQKTQLSENPPPDAQPSGGRLKRRVVAKKTGEFKDMMHEISALVKSYTQLPHDQMQTCPKASDVFAGRR